MAAEMLRGAVKQINFLNNKYLKEEKRGNLVEQFREEP